MQADQTPRCMQQQLAHPPREEPASSFPSELDIRLLKSKTSIQKMIDGEGKPPCPREYSGKPRPLASSGDSSPYFVPASGLAEPDLAVASAAPWRLNLSSSQHCRTSSSNRTRSSKP